MGGAMLRAKAIIRAKACSAVVIVLADAEFITAMPKRVAASRSMLSTPTPARATALSREPGIVMAF